MCVEEKENHKFGSDLGIKNVNTIEKHFSVYAKVEPYETTGQLHSCA